MEYCSKAYAALAFTDSRRNMVLLTNIYHFSTQFHRGFFPRLCAKVLLCREFLGLLVMKGKEWP